MSYKLTKEEMGKMLQESGVNIPENKPWLSTVADWADRNINKPIEEAGIPHLGAGALSAVPHLIQNVANAPGALSNAALGTNIPKLEIPKEYDPSEIVKVKGNSPTQQMMGMAGEIAGSLPAGGAAYGAAMKGLGATAKTPLIGRAAVAGGTGAALSDSDQLGGRGLGAALSAAGPLAAGLSKTGIGQKAGEIANKYGEKYDALYKKIIGEAEKAGASNAMKVPKDLINKTQDIEKLFKHTQSKFNASVKRFSNNPTFENAHKAQSDLGKIIRDIKNQLSSGKTVPSGVSDALQIAENMQKRIRGAMSQSLSKSGRKDLIKEYEGATKGYLEEAVPFKTKDVSQYRYGKGSAKEAGKSLLESKDFAKSAQAKELPGYQAAKVLHDIPPWLKWGAGSTGGLYAAKELGVPVPYLLQQLLEKAK